MEAGKILLKRIVLGFYNRRKAAVGPLLVTSWISRSA